MKMPKTPSNPLLSRRQFLGALAATGAAAATAGAVLVSGCSSGDGDGSELENIVSQNAGDASIDTLEVEVEQVVESSDYDEAPWTDYLKLTKTWELPYGTLLFMEAPSLCTLLMPGDAAGSLMQLALLDVNNGTVSVLLEHAQGQDEGYVIYDARASELAVIWVECNLATGAWRTYLAQLAGTTLGRAHLLDEGDAVYDPPRLAISGNKAYWTFMPNAAGPASTEDSYLRYATVGAGEAPVTNRSVYVSHGRMITNPEVSGDTLTIVPRVDTGNIYYQITALDIAGDRTTAVSILPQSMRVSDAVHLPTGFSFCTENNYGYAAGLAYFGTYYQLASDRYLHVSRQPAGAPVFFNNCLVVKSTKNIVGMDTDKNRFFILDTIPGCADHGDILAACGIQDRLVAYTTAPSAADPATPVVVVRVFDVMIPGQSTQTGETALP
jgi:hypothetical protein